MQMCEIRDPSRSGRGKERERDEKRNCFSADSLFFPSTGEGRRRREGEDAGYNYALHAQVARPAISLSLCLFPQHPFFVRQQNTFGYAGLEGREREREKIVRRRRG